MAKKSKSRKVLKALPTNIPSKKSSAGGDREASEQQNHGGSGFGRHSKHGLNSTHRAPAQGTKGGIPDNYVTTGEADVVPFIDDYHTSVPKFKDSKIRGYHTKGVLDMTSQMISTGVVQEPIVQVLEKGFDLEDAVKPWCCFGNVWKARSFAHGLSTDFSSVRLSTEEETHAGFVDFISDWNNIKNLYKAHGSDSHLSYLLHCIGDSVTIDHLDLFSVVNLTDFSQLPPNFVHFVRETVGENFDAKVVRRKIEKEGKHTENVMAKEAFHKMIHASMKRPMKVDFASRKGSKSPESQFLRHFLVSTDKFRILTGSDTPVFVSESDEGSLTVHSHVDGSKIEALDALDLWLDNTLLKCPKSLVTHQKDWKITKSQFINTKDLPSMGKFDLANYLEHGEKLFKFLKDSVKTGYSYWLYRAPGSLKMTLYNVSNISVKQESIKTSPLSLSSGIFENWSLLQPYLPYFGTSTLLKYSEYLREVITEKVYFDLSYDVPDVDATTANVTAIITNNNNPTAKKAELKDNKIQKFCVKLDLQAQKLQRYISSDDGAAWIIPSANDITPQAVHGVVKCIKGIYSTAIALTPNLQNVIYRHGVEQYFRASIKLATSIGPTNERMENLGWSTDEKIRSLLISYAEGLCNVLSCLIDWHGQVNDSKSLNEAEWMYLSCRMNILYGDIFGRITEKVFEKMKTELAVDEKVPSAENHEKIISLYEKALELIPNGKSFRISKYFASSLSNQIIHVEELRNEVNKKTAFAYLRVAQFCLAFPSFFNNVVGKPSHEEQIKKNQFRTLGKTFYSRDGDDNIDPSALITPDELTRIRINSNNIKILQLLEKCLEYAEKVQDGKDNAQSIKMCANTMMGNLKVRCFQLKNATLSECFSFNEKLAMEIPVCFDINPDGEGPAVVDCDGGNKYDHFLTSLISYKEQPVSDQPVFLQRSFENGEAISEALTYFSTAMNQAVDEKHREKIKKAKDALLNTSEFLDMVHQCNCEALVEAFRNKL